MQESWVEIASKSKSVLPSNGKASKASSDAPAATSDVRQLTSSQRRDAKCVVGSAKRSTGLRGASKSGDAFFISNVDKEFALDDFSRWLKTEKVEFVEVHKVSKDDAPNNSFKLLVPSAESDRMLDPEFWPEGIYCRQWRNKF